MTDARRFDSHGAEAVARVLDQIDDDLQALEADGQEPRDTSELAVGILQSYVESGHLLNIEKNVSGRKVIRNYDC